MFVCLSIRQQDYVRSPQAIITKPCSIKTTAMERIH